MKKNRLSINRKNFLFITALTLITIIALSALVITTIASVNKSVKKASFEKLSSSARQLAGELYTSAYSDHTILSAIATLIAGKDDVSDEEICRILASYGFENSYISYVEVLRPDGTLLDAGGTVTDASSVFDFATEAEKGSYISNIMPTPLNPNEKVIRNAVPVVKNGKTVFMLYGIVNLSEFAKTYTTDIYDGETFILLEDGDSGEFLLDTWHKMLGNISDLTESKLTEEFSWEEILNDLENGRSGNIALLSSVNGKLVYLHYEPVGINNWNVMIMANQETAMKESSAVNRRLYTMAAGIGGIFLIYMTGVVVCLFRAYTQIKRLATTDQNTALLNRNAYDDFVTDSQNKVFASITCIYIDVNGLHEFNNRYGHASGDAMLRFIADALKEQFGSNSLFRVGGDEFIVFSLHDDIASSAEKMAAAIETIVSHGYAVSYGIVLRENETGVDRVIREADEQMLQNKRDYYNTHERRKTR